MNIIGLGGALAPVFFVVALGFFAGKRNAFDPNQAATLSKLAMSFALPAALFVSMTDIRRDLLLQQGRLVLALMLAHIGLFLVAWIVLRRVNSLRGAPSIIYSLTLATSGTPVFGLAILEPILGATSAGAVGLVALAIYLTVPLAVVLLEMNAATKNQETGTDHSKPSPVMKGFRAGLKSPLLWGPVLGIAVVLARLHLPSFVVSSLELIGSAASGVAVFSVVNFSGLPGFAFRPESACSLARVAVQSSTLFVLLHLLMVNSPFSREALVCCSFPLGPLVVLIAARYESTQSETSSMLLISTLGLAITVPAILWISR